MERVERLPKAASDLVAVAQANGWRVDGTQGEDTAGAPYITLNIHGDEYTEYRLTWHTRGTGTYRLFSAIARKKYRAWHDMPSLKAIRSDLEQHASPVVREVREYIASLATF